jgi:hypothetical protein
MARWFLSGLAFFIHRGIERAPHPTFTPETCQPWPGWRDDLAKLKSEHPEWAAGIEAAADEARHPKNVPLGYLAERVEHTKAGHTITKFYGAPKSWMNQFMPPRSRGGSIEWTTVAASSARSTGGKGSPLWGTAGCIRCSPAFCEECASSQQGHRICVPAHVADHDK